MTKISRHHLHMYVDAYNALCYCDATANVEKKKKAAKENQLFFRSRQQNASNTIQKKSSIRNCSEEKQLDNIRIFQGVEKCIGCKKNRAIGLLERIIKKRPKNEGGSR